MNSELKQEPVEKNSGSEQEISFYESGRFPLLFRLFCVLLGVLMLWFSVGITSGLLFKFDLGAGLEKSTGSPLLATVIAFVMGACFISVWFLHKRMTFDPSRNEVVIYGRSLFGYHYRQQHALSGVSEVRFLHIRMPSGRQWSIFAVFSGGRKSWLGYIDDAKGEKTAIAFAEATHLPVVKA